MFRELTSKEVSQIKADSLSDLFTYLYCCIKSGCRRAGVDFGYTLEELADICEASDVIAWGRAVADQSNQTGAPEAEDEKKSPSAS